MPEKEELNPFRLSSEDSSMDGNESRRSVCPVGAVSKTTTSYFISWTSFMSSEKESASSIPGSEVDRLPIRSFSLLPVSSFIPGMLNIFLKSIVHLRRRYKPF